MKYVKSHYNDETGEWDETIVEEEGGLAFSTTTNFPIERLKQNKQKNENENKIQKNKNEI